MQGSGAQGGMRFNLTGQPYQATFSLLQILASRSARPQLCPRYLLAEAS